MRNYLIHIRSGEKVVTCRECRSASAVRLSKKHNGGGSRLGETTNEPCTLPELHAVAHVEQTCVHEEPEEEAKPTGIPVLERLPLGLAREIYQHFGSQEFKTDDVTEVFGRRAGDLMKRLRKEYKVRFWQPCGPNTHYVHQFRA